MANRSVSASQNKDHHMKLISTWALGMVSCLNAQAQSTDTTKHLVHQLGAEVTYFVRQFTNFNGDPGGYPYYAAPETFLTYKHGLGKCRLRLGLGGTFVATTDTGGINSNTDMERRDWSFDARLGIERPVRFGRRWTVYFGADVLGGYSHSACYRLNPQYTNGDEVGEGNRWGGGPVLGFQFQLNRYLSLATEATAYLLWTRQSSTLTDYYDQPTIKSYSETGRLYLNPPARLYLFWHF